ncbi:MAG: hypothetical protein UV38_C0002G0100 [candidate division TM6 bacterium GW2011_GWE2_42_60]|nr:MAG: hypothetical protein UV38_C0002G0100 [candidate division TM6 bacterium GW2011_GWE2_42_60]HBY06142.1 hypothetical protein [Candidatus Dependentiae bacterium]
MINNQYPFDESQLIVSYDLLRLIDWLVKNDPESIKKIVETAQQNGYNTTTKHRHSVLNATTDLRESITGFFLLLEEAFLETAELEENDKHSTATPASIITTIEAIDSSLCDKETLLKSTERTQRALKQDDLQNPKELFYRELLKSWKPRKKSLSH